MPRGRHLTLLVRDERGWRNLCRIITLAHAHTRDGPGRRELGEPSVELQAVLDHAEGLVCLTGCAARSALGSGARRTSRVRAAAPARRVRPRGPARGAAASLRAPRSRPQPRAGGARAAAGGGVRGDRRRARPRALAGRAAGRVRRAAPTTRRSTPPSRCGAATAAT